MTRISPGSRSRNRLGIDQVESGWLGGHDVGIAKAAENKGRKPMRIADGNRRIFGHQNQRERALGRRQGLGDGRSGMPAFMLIARGEA